MGRHGQAPGIESEQGKLLAQVIMELTGDPLALLFFCID
jgi:hypothetical protein